jgi:hypothetical protein
MIKDYTSIIAEFEDGTNMDDVVYRVHFDQDKEGIFQATSLQKDYTHQ